jgi:hypothetical protein
MADIDEFIARTIALNIERGDVVPERHFDGLRRPEHEPADPRMQPVGADHQVGLTRGA